MTTIEAAKASGPLKIAGGVLFLAASVGLMFHRMPHREYVAVHADKPRPKTDGEASTPASPVSRTAVRPPPTPTSKPPVRAPQPVPPPAALPPAEPLPEAVMEIEDWTDDCRSEIGLLCHGVPTKGLVRCLSGYDDGLMRLCRRSLKRFRSPGPPMIEAESGSEP